MGIQTRVIRRIYSLLLTEVEGFGPLAELALCMRWSWNYTADELWLQLDPALWGLTRNPLVVLQTVTRDLLERVHQYNAKGGGLLGDGPAAQVILSAASELPAQLLVVGTHGRTGLSRIALGSVANAVVRAAPCSVLTVQLA